MKRRGVVVVVIEEVKEAIETVRVIDIGTGTGTESAVVKEMAKDPTAVADMMVQRADMVIGIATAKGTETTIVSAGAKEVTIMRDLNVVKMTESKGKDQKYLTIYHRHHHRLIYPRHLLHIVLVVQLSEETARSTTIYRGANVTAAVMLMMMIL